MAYITIVKGDDTDFLDNQYLVVKFNTEIELAGFQAIFMLGNVELLYPDLSAKYIEIVLSKEVTSALQKGWIYHRFVEKPQENYRLIVAPTTNNIYLPPHFIKSIVNKGGFYKKYRY